MPVHVYMQSSAHMSTCLHACPNTCPCTFPYTCRYTCPYGCPYTCAYTSCKSLRAGASKKGSGWQVHMEGCRPGGWQGVQHGHTCYMGTCVIWSHVQYGLVCNVEGCGHGGWQGEFSARFVPIQVAHTRSIYNNLHISRIMLCIPCKVSIEQDVFGIHAV